MTTWFTGDTHFNHKNIVGHSQRPFENMEQMNQKLIENWNNCVAPGDDVFHLGDFAWRDAAEIRDQLKGNIHLIRGNHESAAEKIKQRFIWLKDVHEIKVRPALSGTPNETPATDITASQWIFLSHYAHRVWPRSHHGVWHLYGHSHGSLSEDKTSLSFDVGVDATARRLAGIALGGKIDWEFEEIVGTKLNPEDYRPLAFEEVKRVMSFRLFKPIDHHTAKMG